MEDRMDSLTGIFDSMMWGRAETDATRAIASLLFAFVAGQVVAWTYAWTHVGVSYSRAFVQSLVLIAVVVALVLMIVGTNVLVAFGLFGALAVIRFRNVLKDTRDTAFIFMELAVGLGAGTQALIITAAGVAFFVLVAMYLRATSFGAVESADALLRLQAPAPAPESLAQVLERHCRRADLVSRRAMPDNTTDDLSYRLVFRDPSRGDELVSELRAVEGVRSVSMLVQGEQAEL
jgi:hypothetical protein